jgi:hypothetical protein
VNARTAARLGWSLFPLSVILWVIALVLNLRRTQDSRLAFTTGELALAFAFLLFGWFGALVVSRRPGHPIGWLLCALGLATGLAAFANEYAIYGLISHPGAVPGAAAAAWSTSWVFAIELGLLTALLVLFPSGRPLSPRWGWLLWLAGLGSVLAVVGALSWWPQRGAELLLVFASDEPVGVLATLYDVGFWLAITGILAALASVVVRFVRARGAERQQLKWLVYAALIIPYPSRWVSPSSGTGCMTSTC